MSAEDAASGTTQKPIQPDAPEQKDVLRIIAEVERSLGALRARADAGSSHADTQRLLVDEIERLKRETTRLGDERAQLLEKQLSLESQLASAHANRAVAEEHARRAEEHRSRFEQETLNSQISRETEFIKSLEARAAADHARADELERQCAEARQELAVAMSKLTAVLKVAEKHAMRASELESEAEALRAELGVARKLQRDGHIALSDSTEMQAQIQQTIMPRLAQVAEFLRVRKQRLAGLHHALKRRG
jgi:DNA repair exonuclease SbcCD ATPase subunit